MGFLRILGLGLVDHRRFRQKLAAEVACNHLAQFVERIVGQAGRIGTHIADQANHTFIAECYAFIQALRDAHGAAGREAEFAGGFLLQRRRGERR